MRLILYRRISLLLMISVIAALGVTGCSAAGNRPAYYGSILKFNKDQEVFASIVGKAQGFVDIDRIARDWVSRVYDYAGAIAEQHFFTLSASVAVLTLLLIVLAVLLIKNNNMRMLHKAALEQIKFMFDTTPLCCNLWNEDIVQIDVNQEAVRLFGLKDKQEYLDRFFELSPERQPDGSLSKELAIENVKTAFRDGYAQFEYMHQKYDGTPIPAEVKLIRIQTDKGKNIVAGYIRDLREQKQMMKEIAYQNKLLETVNRVSATLLEPDITRFENLLFKAMGMIAEEIDIDRLCIWKNYRKDGRLYSTLVYEWLSDALLRDGSCTPEDLSFDDDIPGFEDMFSRGIFLNKLTRDFPPEAWAHASKRKILAVFMEPIFIDDHLWGFFAFDDCHKEKLFTQDEEMILRSVSGMIVNALMRKEMTLDILNTSAKLEEAIREATEANKAKSDFLAKMSHEIRTPMNAILGMTELALREDLSPVAREYAVTVKQAGVNLLSIINDILDFSKIESGNMQVVEADYYLSSLINDVVSIARVRAVDSQLRFAVFLDGNLPNVLIGDELRIRQVLINLLGNAFKYTDNGFVSFTINGEMTGEDTIRMSMEVKDSGRGIRQEDIGKLFQDFSQLDAESTKNIDGVGLGLSISASLINAMGGDIAVESEHGKGSAFTVTMPQKIRHRERIAVVPDSAEKNTLIYERRGVYVDSAVYTFKNLGIKYTLASSDGQFRDAMAKDVFTHVFIAYPLLEKNIDTVLKFGGNSQIVILAEYGESVPVRNAIVLSMPLHAISVANVFNSVSDRFSYNSGDDMIVRFTAPEAKVLVVDDISTNLKVANGLLLPYMMEVDLCRSGAEAIRAVKSKKYDIVFMDHRMPEMDGMEATGHIRALGGEESYYAGLPIIALTANAVSGMEELFLQNGFNGFLTKPVDTVKLNSILEKWIPKEKQAGAALKNESTVNTNKIAMVSMAIEGIDVNRGINLSGGTIEYFYETLAAFHEDGTQRKDEISQCLGAGNLHQYTTHVHALKGASANVGAQKISEMAYALEMAGRRGDMTFIEVNNDGFLFALDQLLSNIKKVLTSLVENDEKACGAPESGQFRNELDKLKSALDTLDFEKVNHAVDALSLSAPTGEARIAVRNIAKHILMYEYDEAGVLIESLLQR